MRFLHYFHAAISIHLSEKPKLCLVVYMFAQHRFECTRDKLTPAEINTGRKNHDRAWIIRAG